MSFFHIPTQLVSKPSRIDYKHHPTETHTSSSNIIWAAACRAVLTVERKPIKLEQSDIRHDERPSEERGWKRCEQQTINLSCISKQEKSSIITLSSGKLSGRIRLPSHRSHASWIPNVCTHRTNLLLSHCRWVDFSS